MTVHRPSGHTAVMSARTEAPQTVGYSGAKALGLKWYFTGQPCAHGHIAKRTVSNRECRRCVDVKRIAKRAADPAHFRAKEHRKYHRDVECSREQGRQARARHVERRRDDDRRRYHDNPDRMAACKERGNTWWRSNRGKKNFMVQRRRAYIKRATPPWLTAEQKAEIRGFYIRAAAMPGEWHVDHIRPLRGKTVCGLHVPWNLQILPGDDNRRKRNVFGEA